MSPLSVPAVFALSISALLRSAYARVGAAANLTLSPGLHTEMKYTQNSLCRQNYCTNPIFPGINDLPRLEALQWQCSSTSMVHQHMSFCKDAVAYDPALPSPTSKATPVNELVKAQEDAAMTMFVYHLNGMGFDAWDHRDPSQSDNDCVRSVWKMVCFTYFPRAEAGCKEGEQSAFKRPCKSSCQNYLKHCAVECCDESVQCVFQHTSTSATGELKLLQSGYADTSGPSATCTGSSRRSNSSPVLILLAILGIHLGCSASSTAPRVEAQRQPRRVGRYLLFGIIGVLALFLQGCEGEIPKHNVGNWRGKPSYLNQFKYVPPGKGSNEAVLNSCSQTDISATLQCNGRGYCRSFSTSGLVASEATPVSFCQCDRDWADPECGSKRKSQMTAFFYSLFLGYVGADYFYLGYPLWGMVKLLTLGGCGFWWLVDIVRTASGPVYAYNYRTASDLPHWVAILILTFVFMLVGFLIAIESYMAHRRRKREDITSLQHAEETQNWKQAQADARLDGPRYRTTGPTSFAGRPEFSGYGTTLPVAPMNAQASYAQYGNSVNQAGFAL